MFGNCIAKTFEMMLNSIVSKFIFSFKLKFLPEKFIYIVILNVCHLRFSYLIAKKAEVAFRITLLLEFRARLATFLGRGNPSSTGWISLSTLNEGFPHFMFWLDQRIFQRNPSFRVWQKQ